MKKIVILLFAVTITLFLLNKASADLNDGLVAYYPFNGNADDESGNGLHGTVYGGATLTEDRFGIADSAYSLDGIDDYIGMGYNVFSRSDLIYSSYAVWTKTTTSGGYPINIEGSIFMRMIRFSIDALNAQPSCDCVGADDGNWHLLAATIEPYGFQHEVKCYVDGVLQETSYEPLAYYIDDRNSRFVLGMGPVSDWSGGSSDSNFVEGKIDDVLIYNRTLSESEIQELYQESVLPQDMLTNLVNEVILLNLQQGISNSLDAKLDSSMGALDDTNENNDVSAINSLYAFINAVEAQRGNKLSDTDADSLVSAAQAIIDKLNAQ